MKLCSPYFRHQIFIMVPQHIPTCQNPTMGFDSNDSKQLGICQRRIPTIEYNGGDGDDNEKKTEINAFQCQFPPSKIIGWQRASILPQSSSP